MTDYDALEKRLREIAEIHRRELMVNAARVEDEAADAILDLRAERDAEKLKRQQAEHERDCILEDLAGAVEVLKAWDQFWSKQEGDWPPLNSTRAFLALAAQEKP